MPLFNRRNRGGKAKGQILDLRHNEADIDPNTGYKINKTPSQRALRGGGYTFTKVNGAKGTYSSTPKKMK